MTSSKTNLSEFIGFATWVTGHDKETVKQLYRDFQKPDIKMVGAGFYCENESNDKPRCGMQCRECRDL